jgi:hypothetical protein
MAAAAEMKEVKWSAPPKVALSYVRSAWGNKASVVMLDQVKKIHAADPPGHPNWNPSELQQFPDKD